jgi:hypothetical protein
MLVRPDGSVLNKGQVLKDLREQGLTFRSIDLKDAGRPGSWFDSDTDG